MKLFKLFLTTLLVFTLGGINPVQAEGAGSGTKEFVIKNGDDLLAAAESGEEDTIWRFYDNVVLTKLHSTNELNNNSHIKIPAGTIIIGNHFNLDFELEKEVKLTKVFSALGNVDISGLDITAPFRSNPDLGKYQFTQTLFSFSKESREIVLSNLTLRPSEQSVIVEPGEEPHSNFGVGLYFYSNEDAEVLFNDVRITSGRLQFEKGSKGNVEFRYTKISQDKFLNKDGLEDEIIYVVDDNSWDFTLDDNTTFELGRAKSEYSYLNKLLGLVGQRFTYANLDFSKHFNNEISKGTTTIKLSSTDLWDEKMVTDILDNILSDDEKYGEYKDFKYILTYGVGGKSYDSDWHEPVKLENGKPVPVGKHQISIEIQNPKIGLEVIINTAFVVESIENLITPETVIDEDIQNQFGTVKPSVTFPEGTFTEPVTIGFSLSTIAPNNLDKAIDYINKSLKGTEVGRTFTLDINALSVNGAVVKSIGDNLIEVTVPMPESMKNTNRVRIYFINQNTFEAEWLDTTLNEDGSITFLTSHFSNFMIAEIVDAKDEPATELPDVDVEETPGEELTPKPTEKPKDKDTTVPVLPETGMNTGLSLGTPLVVLGMLLIAVDQLKRYKKRINN